MSDTNRTKNTNEIITGYKAFDPDFSCRGYPYTVGKTFEHNGKIELCSGGFHFCHKDPFDVFQYYPLVLEESGLPSRFAKVSAPKKDVVVGRDDGGDKCVTSKISIDKEITLDDLINEQVEKAYNSKDEAGLLIATERRSTLTDQDSHTKIISNKDDTRVALTHDYSRALVSAYGTYLASSGYGTGLFATGMFTRLSSSGYGSKIYNSGYHSSTSSSGADAELRIVGDDASLSASGSGAKLRIRGDGTSIASSGGSAVLNVEGNYTNTSSSGEASNLRITGKCAGVASSGSRSKLTATGNGARIAVVGNDTLVTYKGKDGVISVLGEGAKFKGSRGTLVLAVTYNRHGKPHGGLVGRIGENGLKPNTLYTVKNGEFVEVGA